jgi:hypothetical protein
LLVDWPRIEIGPAAAVVRRAIRTVNAEAHAANACALATVAHVRGAKAGTARSKAGTFEIVEVLVVGVETRRGLQQAGPVVYFTLFKVEERPA